MKNKTYRAGHDLAVSQIARLGEAAAARTPQLGDHEDWIAGYVSAFPAAAQAEINARLDSGRVGYPGKDGWINW